MQATLRPDQPVCAEDEKEVSYLNVLIAYEDRECNERALRAYDALVAHLGDAFVCSQTTWKFDLLRFREMRAMAVRDALDADIIVLCAHQRDELPAEVHDWLQEWAPRKRNEPSALVALFEGSEDLDPILSGARERVEQIARQAHMTFFSEARDILPDL